MERDESQALGEEKIGGAPEVQGRKEQVLTLTKILLRREL